MGVKSPRHCTDSEKPGSHHRPGGCTRNREATHVYAVLTQPTRRVHAGVFHCRWDPGSHEGDFHLLYVQGSGYCSQEGVFCVWLYGSDILTFTHTNNPGFSCFESFHCASKIPESGSEQEPHGTMSVLNGTKNLFNGIENSNIKIKWNFFPYLSAFKINYFGGVEENISLK